MRITGTHTVVSIELAVSFTDPQTPGECEMPPLKMHTGGFIQPSHVRVTLRHRAPDADPHTLTGDTVMVEGWELTSRRKLRLDRRQSQVGYHTGNQASWPPAIARLYRAALRNAPGGPDYRASWATS